jgi:molybdopterin-guanine dinucleotide biosynthesis protein B
LVPLLGFAAFSGTGKTTLLRSLLPALNRQGLRVAVIKHAHHSFEVDKPGKDSYELRKAGARRMLVASRNLRALIEETPGGPEPCLGALLTALPQDDLDLVLVEGFKHERFPKIELHRPSLGKPLLFPEDDSILAIATDASLPAQTRLPVLPLNDPEAIAAFVLDRVAGAGGPPSSGPPRGRARP